MAATSHGSVHGSMHMYEDVCVLCAVKPEETCRWYGGVKSDFSLSLIFTVLLSQVSLLIEDFLFLYEIRVGTLNISRCNGWFRNKCHLFIKIKMFLF